MGRNGFFAYKGEGGRVPYFLISPLAAAVR